METGAPAPSQGIKYTRVIDCYTRRVIPLRDVIPSRTTPFVCYALIVLNALAFLYEQSLTDRGLRQFIMTWGLVPAMFD
jgi:membrane associated rhomboid family serine protease